jgi:hypothetical protein
MRPFSPFDEALRRLHYFNGQAQVFKIKLIPDGKEIKTIEEMVPDIKPDFRNKKCKLIMCQCNDTSHSLSYSICKFL